MKDQESFRHAGSRVFSKAQYRMDVIARTEVLRAHNQGRIKFHRRVGVRKLEWMTMEDERVCPVCGPLDGKVFDTDRFPPHAHPNCRCTSVVAWPTLICGANQQTRNSELGMRTKAETADGFSPLFVPRSAFGCVHPSAPGHRRAGKSESRGRRQLKAAFESGQIADLNTLTVKQLQTLAKQNGWQGHSQFRACRKRDSRQPRYEGATALLGPAYLALRLAPIARTKAEFIKLLDQVEPGVDHSTLSGAALKAKLNSLLKNTSLGGRGSCQAVFFQKIRLVL